MKKTHTYFCVQVKELESKAAFKKKEIRNQYQINKTKKNFQRSILFQRKFLTLTPTSKSQSVLTSKPFLKKEEKKRREVFKKEIYIYIYVYLFLL